MDEQPKATLDKPEKRGTGLPLSKISSIEMLSVEQLQWVDYCVVQGLITYEDGSWKKFTVEDFAQKIGVDRVTLYRWKNGIPKFWDFVAQRRKLIFSKTRVQKVYNAMYLKALAGDVRAQQTFLANSDDGFRMPAQKVEVEAGNSWAALLNRRRNTAEIVEGETVDEPTTA